MWLSLKPLNTTIGQALAQILQNRTRYAGCFTSTQAEQSKDNFIARCPLCCCHCRLCYRPLHCCHTSPLTRRGQWPDLDASRAKRAPLPLLCHRRQRAPPPPASAQHAAQADAPCSRQPPARRQSDPNGQSPSRPAGPFSIVTRPNDAVLLHLQVWRRMRTRGTKREDQRSSPPLSSSSPTTRRCVG